MVDAYLMLVNKILGVLQMKRLVVTFFIPNLEP